MKKNQLYGVILEPPVEASKVLRILKKLDEAEVDYIMPKPGTVAVLGKDLLKIHDLLQTGVRKRVINWSGEEVRFSWLADYRQEPYPPVGWKISEIYPKGPFIKFFCDDDDCLLFIHNNKNGVSTTLSNTRLYWKDALEIINRYGFKDDDIKRDDYIWKVANQP